MARVVTILRNPHQEVNPSYYDKTFLWAVHKGKVFVALGESDTHLEWFDRIGLPTSGHEFDRVNRGYVRILGDVVSFQGPDRFPPEEVVRKFFSKYPKYKGYQVENPAEELRNPRGLQYSDKELIMDAVEHYKERGFHDAISAFDDWTYHRELEFGYDDIGLQGWRKLQPQRKKIWRSWWLFRKL